MRTQDHTRYRKSPPSRHERKRLDIDLHIIRRSRPRYQEIESPVLCWAFLPASLVSDGRFAPESGHPANIGLKGRL
jgi:hypothetical protein